MSALHVVVKDLENLGFSECVLRDFGRKALRESVFNVVDQTVNDVVGEDCDAAGARILKDVGVDGEVEGDYIG